MARITMIEKEDADAKVKEIYADIERHFGVVPNLFKAFAPKPEVLKANWEKTKGLMLAGKLERRLKEMVAVTVSAANNCKYCVGAHSMFLRKLGVDKETVATITEDIDRADISEKEKKILKLGIKSSRCPHEITDQEIEELELDDEELTELISVIDLFTSFNKFIDTLQIDLDSFIK